MRNPTAPAPSGRAAPRRVPRKTGAAAPAKAAQPASRALPHDGPEASAPMLSLTMSAGPSLLEGPSVEALIRARAYERYERNGRVDGNALEDWLAAEAEVGAMLR